MLGACVVRAAWGGVRLARPMCCSLRFYPEEPRRGLGRSGVPVKTKKRGSNVETTLTRRNFVTWGAATAGAAALVGFTGCSSEGTDADDGKQPEGEPGEGNGQVQAVAVDARMPAPAAETGKWLPTTCMYNCSCGASRCLLKVYVEDGVPLAIRSDDEDEDSYAMPQRRACVRGRAQISNHLSPARIKYPMKRKSWSARTNLNGDLRGQATNGSASAGTRRWIYVADGHTQVPGRPVRADGHTSAAASSNTGDGHPHLRPERCACWTPSGGTGACGGGQRCPSAPGRSSTRTWSAASAWRTRRITLQLRTSELHVLFGCNWAANQAGQSRRWWLERMPQARAPRSSSSTRG